MTGSPVVRSHGEVLAEWVPLAGARVADVGCGAGALSRFMRSQGADVTGIECGESMLRAARAADADHAEKYVDGTGQSLPFDDGRLDAVVYSYSFHHVPRAAMATALTEARRVLRPGGVLYVVEPAAEGPRFEVVRLVEDETEVRAWAQEALAAAVAIGFVVTERFRYTNELVYDGADAMAAQIVGVDPARADALAAARPEFDRRFAANARPVDGGFSFTQDNLVAVLHKPA